MSRIINCKVLSAEVVLDDSDTEDGSSQSPSKGALVRQHHTGPNYMIFPTEGVLHRIQCDQNKSKKEKDSFQILHCPSPYVSKSHCQLFWRDGKYWIQDLGSTNGTFVNGKRLVRHRVARLRLGDMIAIAGAYEDGAWLTNVKDEYCFVYLFQKVDPKVTIPVEGQESEQSQAEAAEHPAE